MMKKAFLILAVVSCFVSAGPLGGNPTNGYCQTVDGSACGWSGNSGPSRRGYKVPDRWGAIYYNPVNDAIGYSENNTEGYRSANKEALANCIKAGGGRNPVTKSEGKGCRMLTEVRNFCSAIAIGTEGYGAKNDAYLEKAEQKALAACSEYSDKCVIKYSGCSYHPDYRR